MRPSGLLVSGLVKDFIRYENIGRLLLEKAWGCTRKCLIGLETWVGTCR
jgi:hypothetical protein